MVPQNIDKKMKKIIMIMLLFLTVAYSCNAEDKWYKTAWFSCRTINEDWTDWSPLEVSVKYHIPTKGTPTITIFTRQRQCYSVLKCVSTQKVDGITTSILYCRDSFKGNCRIHLRKGIDFYHIYVEYSDAMLAYQLK